MTRTLRFSDVCDEVSQIRAVISTEESEVLDGEFNVVGNDGQIRMIISYHQGVVHGPFTEYWSNGICATVGEFNNGVKVGEWKYYNQDGSFNEKVLYSSGKEVIDSTFERRTIE